jgi:hypothetical protein
MMMVNKEEYVEHWVTSSASPDRNNGDERVLVVGTLLPMSRYVRRFGFEPSAAKIL